MLDAVLDAGRGHGIRPFGEEALMMLRIEAGLPLVDVEWHNSRLAFTDHERVTPNELGMGWMLRGVARRRPRLHRRRRDPARAGRRRPRAGPPSASSSTGRTGTRCTATPACCPPKDEHPLPYESVLHDRPTTAGGSQVGYVTSFMYSPVLQRHIGLARVRPDLAAPGTEVHMEIAINHSNTTVLARTAKLPLFNPARKTARP